MTTAASAPLHSNTAVATTAAVAATTQVAATQTRSNRRKVKDFNDSITCTLCSGYLIEATTVNDCLHTFCRSCIVRYLECNKYCPKCKSYNNKTITVANLRPDRILKSLVYKLVPGLYKSENQRVTRFYSDQFPEPGSPGGTRKLSPEHGLLEDQNFFSPDELISLSLEYHYESIADYDPKRTQLPVTYLHCPAAVTIHHLYKFILTKNGLQVDSDRIQVDIIYEDEILPHEFTLMDVAYCFDYRRVSPMRLFYRIFIHPTAKPTATTTTTHSVGGSSDKNSNASNNNSGERDANNSATSNGKPPSNLNESQGSAESSSSSTSPSTSSPGKGVAAAAAATDDVSGGRVGEGESVNGSVNSATDEQPLLSVRPSEAKPVEASGSNSYKSVESKYDSKLIITKTSGNRADKGVGERQEKEPIKLVLVSKKSDKNSSKVIYSKSEPKSSKSPSSSSPTSPGDFKRLRSSDIRYSDYETASTSFASSSSKSGTVPGDDSTRKSESHSAKKHNKINNDYTSAGDSSGKKFPGDNSRNKTNGSSAASRNGANDATLVESAKSKHEKSKSSPHRSESNGSAVAITASTGATTTAEKNEKSSELKCYVNLKKQTVVSPLSAEASSANRKLEVPKLKIELPSLKTKISIPKQDSSERSPKSAHSSSTSSSAATSPTASTSSTSGKSPIWPPKADDKPSAPDVNSIGIEEYAKTIGLKPVYKSGSEPGEWKKKKKSSTSFSPDPFSSSSHRKRKKAKHSKEAGSGGKRRKLHAEISSQHELSSLKMKVKLTEKPSKHERKPSEEVASSTAKQIAEVGPSSSAAPVTTKADEPKVIDITKGDDDDDVKIIEQPTPAPPAILAPAVSEPVKTGVETATTRVNELPKLPALAAVSDNGSTKAKINEMRAIRHKPMVYIPNPIDKNLSDTSSTINNLIQSVQAKTGFIDKDNDVQIVTTAVKMPPLVPTKPVVTVSSMKPPTVIPSVNSRIAASNSIPKPPQKMFSPRHSPSYPPLALQIAPKKVAVAAPISSTNIYQPRSSVPVGLKRSSSVDSGSTYNLPPKTPRVDHFEAANRLQKKPCYAPMFNFVKGASLAKNGTTNSMPTSANDVPYKSPISSTYTKEIATKKSVPSLLLPPSSISVTKMTDVAPQPARIDNRPALEIVRIPSTAPVADKPQPKTTRPPPPTIPLIKIKKSNSLPEHPTSPISPSVFQVTSSSTSASTNLTTSSASSQDTSGGALDLTTRANDDLIILESSDSLTSKLNGNDSKQPASRQPSKLDNSQLELINSLIQSSAASMIKAGPSMMAKLGGIPGLKLPADMIGFAITSSNTPNLSTITTSTTKSMPMPKLAEISSRPTPKLAARQPNPSVRSIPNPSALAFRNQTIPSTVTSPTRVLNVNTLSRPSSDVSYNNNNNNSSNLLNNNKNDGVSSTTTGGKKTIEKVAAGLRAAAATATTSPANQFAGGNRVSSSNGNSAAAATANGGGKNGVNVV
ncbi:protein suppressor 2 of zeste [Culex quinquefasciatus]|uniref:protein suppressor 2 of zeste n=1 Tax=Culex quinquefasciatus TaxID=7176 RepID=UPI0018E37F1C|nr:protein suppressor 2 of zeste [Culex quinquefasciatus]XP_038118526.1 protein suppressor 2 of zeste [Culex quinquefasciatus]XP_038118527.1 protein suppressor 2 of zeste [Culex quinquefasciatus]XP_038118528.1 protein suppressor 2 of zeste [Culex quinquefasciatus]XP_038118529.1 protein suppressor 2 of zeste [Culex quinquefasciatus]